MKYFCSLGLLKWCGVAVALLTLAALLMSSHNRGNVKPCYTTDIAIAEDGTLLLANKGTAELLMLSAEGESLHSWSLAEPATGVVVNGDKAFVTSSYAVGRLTCVELEGERRVLFSVQLPMGACAPTVSGDGKQVYVCNRYAGSVSAVDASTGELLGEVKVLREPCAAALSSDGKTLYVNNFLPAQRADVEYVAAEVSVIDCATFEKIKDIKLCNGSNALRGVAASKDGKYIFVSHNLGRYQVPTSQLQQGWMNTNAVSVIDAQRNELVGAFSLDEPDRGAGGVWDVVCDGEHLVVSQSGTHDVSIIDYGALVERLEAYEDYSQLDHDLYFLRGVRERVALQGNGARNMAVREGKLFLPAYFSDVLNVVDLAAQSVTAVEYNPDRVESAVDRGERAFNDAALCYQNWQSCNGCHPGEGRADAMNWDLMNDGIGNPKNCKSMLYAFQTPKCMISGIRDHAGLAVRAGYKFIQFCDVEESVATDVDEYLRSLRPLPSPYLQNGELSAKAVEGKRVFDKYSCGACHCGDYYTDMRTHRIGEDVEFEQGWDTPTLCEVWRTAPYLFDGRAATMFDVFYEHRHGIEGKISRKDAEALAEYVLSL